MAANCKFAISAYDFFKTLGIGPNIRAFCELSQETALRWQD